MNPPTNQILEYRKFFLTRLTVTTQFVDYLDKCVSFEDESAKHSYHKIMVHNWSDSREDLFISLSQFFDIQFVPVHYDAQTSVTSFYTNSLSLIQKIMKADFLFPSRRSMVTMDVLFNHKNSMECFGRLESLDDIVMGVVERRISDTDALDLSDFCNDKEFQELNIQFYKLALLGIFKLRMLRIARYTKSLNLSNNNISSIPTEILNFFSRGDLAEVDLRHNNLQSLSDVRVFCKIEKLWLEGNPLCDEETAQSYVKHISTKFPRIIELDGISLNNYGTRQPFWRNYLVNPDKKSKMLVEKFLTVYFSNYDYPPRKKLAEFYDPKAKLTINCAFQEALRVPHYEHCSRNALDPSKRHLVMLKGNIYNSREAVIRVLDLLPESEHDPKSFTVDVIKEDKDNIIVVVDGIMKEKNMYSNNMYHFQFRRTFVLKAHSQDKTLTYYITNEMLTVSFALKEQIDSSFKVPSRSLNSLTLIKPNEEDIEAISMILSHLTRLKRGEAEMRLRIHGWDLRKALMSFNDEMRNSRLSPSKFIDSDVSDISMEEDNFDDNDID